MMDHFISMYIDDEMSLEEKILFINTIHGNETYRNDAVSMLEQEKKLVTTLIRPLPERALPFSKAHRSLHSMGLALAACVLLVVSFLAGVNLNSLNGSLHQDTVMISGTVQHRFVLHHQGSAQVEITGSFTEWQKVPLIPTGSEGYWEITLDVPAGEHRYSFVIDGTRLLPDPTVATKEPDDFGSVNSILFVES
jgi:hypothetical protein